MTIEIPRGRPGQPLGKEHLEAHNLLVDEVMRLRDEVEQLKNKGMNYVRLDSSGQTWTVPEGITWARFQVRNSGAGGGSGNTSNPGGGGSAGIITDQMLPVISGQVYIAFIASGAPSDSPGALTGAYLQDTDTWILGNGINASLGRSADQGGNGGAYGGHYNSNSSITPPWSSPVGSGGSFLWGGNLSQFGPTGPVCGGTAGNFSNGGYAQQTGDPLGGPGSFWGWTNNLAGLGGGSPDANGMTATEPGCGGGGGSLNSPGGSGAPGLIEIWW